MTDTTPATKQDLDELAIQIVKLLNPRFDAVEKRMAAIEEKLERLTSTLFERLLKWAKNVSKKTGIPIKY